MLNYMSSNEITSSLVLMNVIAMAWYSFNKHTLACDYLPTLESITTVDGKLSKYASITMLDYRREDIDSRIFCESSTMMPMLLKLMPRVSRRASTHVRIPPAVA
jgi:hypothetical protein